MWQTVVFALSLSLDSLAAGAATGGAGIRIPAASGLALSGICGALLGCSMGLSGLLSGLLDPGVCRLCGGLLLMGMGLMLLLQWLAKRWLRSPHRFQGKVGPLGFVLELCLDQTQADLDRSQSLSLREAAALAVSLSLDSVGAGLGWGLQGHSWLATSLLAFGFGWLALELGHRLGAGLARRAARGNPGGALPDLSFLGGGTLLLLGLWRLL